MKYCIISGLPTENKYKNSPVHEDVIELAKEMMSTEGCSLSEALKKISYMLVNDIRLRLEEEKLDE